MLIRSQDKTALVKFENIVVNLKLSDSLNVKGQIRNGFKILYITDRKLDF